MLQLELIRCHLFSWPSVAHSSISKDFYQKFSKEDHLEDPLARSARKEPGERLETAGVRLAATVHHERRLDGRLLLLRPIHLHHHHDKVLQHQYEQGQYHTVYDDDEHTTGVQQRDAVAQLSELFAVPAVVVVVPVFRLQIFDDALLLQPNDHGVDQLDDVDRVRFLCAECLPKELGVSGIN